MFNDIWVGGIYPTLDNVFVIKVNNCHGGNTIFGEFSAP